MGGGVVGPPAQRTAKSALGGFGLVSRPVQAAVADGDLGFEAPGFGDGGDVEAGGDGGKVVERGVARVLGFGIGGEVLVEEGRAVGKIALAQALVGGAELGVEGFDLGAGGAGAATGEEAGEAGGERAADLVDGQIRQRGRGWG